jgi:tyrosyl-tRNA synthetase
MKGELKDHTLHPMAAKKRLGREIVSRFHGAGAGEIAEENFVKRFKDNEIPEDMPQVSYSLIDGVVLLAKAMTEAGLTKSNGEGRRAIDQGGVKLNGEKVSDTNLELTSVGEHIVQIGKRRFARIMVA